MYVQVDTTESILAAAKDKNWGIIDINLFHNFDPNARQRLLRSQIDPVKDLLTWLWDYYIE